MPAWCGEKHHTCLDPATNPAKTAGNQQKAHQRPHLPQISGIVRPFGLPEVRHSPVISTREPMLSHGPTQGVSRHEIEVGIVHAGRNDRGPEISRHGLTIRLYNHYRQVQPLGGPLGNGWSG